MATSASSSGDSPTHSPDLIYVLETLFAQVTGSGLHRALLKSDVGITEPFEIAGLTDDNINGMQFKNVNNKTQHLAIGQRNKLRAFRDLLAFHHHNGTPIQDVSTITLEAFKDYIDRKSVV